MIRVQARSKKSLSYWKKQGYKATLRPSLKKRDMYKKRLSMAARRQGKQYTRIGYGVSRAVESKYGRREPEHRFERYEYRRQPRRMLNASRMIRSGGNVYIMVGGMSNAMQKRKKRKIMGYNDWSIV